MKRLACALAAVAATTASVVMPSSSAMASTSTTPQCTKSIVVHDAIFGNPMNVPASSGGSINCWMAKGDVSSGVRALQEALTYCEDFPVSIDSDYGNQTKTAVTNVQKVNFLSSQNGVYGPETRHAMNFYYPGRGCGYAG